MVDINSVDRSGVVTPGLTELKAPSFLNDERPKSVGTSNSTGPNNGAKATKEVLVSSAKEVEKVVNSISQDISLSFRVEEELSRMVVAVRAVGSDEIIRQFPPEEFITVAKHIAAQNPDMIDEDYLKGILFDQYS